MRNEIFDKLKWLAEKVRLTKEDKVYIENISDELGMHFEKTGCPSCYKDQAIMMMAKIKSEDIEKAEDGSEVLHLRKGLNVKFRGMLVNELLFDTPEKVEMLLMMGFPEHLTEKR